MKKTCNNTAFILLGILFILFGLLFSDNAMSEVSADSEQLYTLTLEGAELYTGAEGGVTTVTAAAGSKIYICPSKTEYDNGYSFQGYVIDNDVSYEYMDQYKLVIIVTMPAKNTTIKVEYKEIKVDELSSINIPQTTLCVGNTMEAYVKVTPEWALNTNIEWSSTDTSVATVDENGTIIGISSGETVISASTTDGSSINSFINIDVKEHDYSERFVYSDATCEKDGYGRMKCQNCDNYYSFTIDMLGHDIVIDKGCEPNCFGYGLSEGSHCRRCEKVLVPQHRLDITEHNFVVIEAKEPTCTEAGNEEGRRCSICGYMEKSPSTIKALGHEYVTESAKEPTCTEPGYTEERYCLRCNKVFNESKEIAPLGHDTIPIEGVAATCTESGYTEGSYCTRCEQTLVESKEIPPLGHEEVTVPETKPTCTKDGKTSWTRCGRCNIALSIPETIPALGHQSAISYEVAPTCTQTGLTRGSYCVRCNETLIEQNVVEALGHEIVIDSAVEATCEKTGLTEGSHCSRCKTVLKKQYTTQALGHDEIVDIAVEATCTEDGYTTGSHCDRCGIKLREPFVIPAAHTMVYEREILPTCIYDGMTEGEYCSVCGLITKTRQVIPATGHTYSDKAYVNYEPTCTREGSVSYLCKKCQFGYTESIPKLPHKMTHFDAVPATCTNSGYIEYYKCELCHQIFADEAGDKTLSVYDIIISPLGHTVSNGICTRCNLVFESHGRGDIAIDNDTSDPKDSSNDIERSNNQSAADMSDDHAAESGDYLEDSDGISYTVIENYNGKLEVEYRSSPDESAKTVVVPNTVTISGVTYKVTSIGEDAFKNNTKLIKVKIGSNVTSIDDNAFANCTALTKIVIPKNIDTLGKNIFNGCNNLKTITIKSKKLTAKSISKNAFKGIGSKTVIKVPKSKKKQYTVLFRKKGLSKKVKIK